MMALTAQEMRQILLLALVTALVNDKIYVWKKKYISKVSCLGLS